MTEKNNIYYGYIVVIISFFIIAIMYGAIYSYGVFFEPLSTEFGWSNVQTSGAYSMFMVLHGLFYIITGRLNDKYGPKIIMTSCGILLGIGYLLMSKVNMIWHLYLIYGFMIAIGMSGGYVPLISTVSKWFDKKRSMMTGICVAGVGVGTMMMPPIANWLINSYGWRLSFIIIGVFSLIFIVTGSQFLKANPGENEFNSDSTQKMANKENKPVINDFSIHQVIYSRQFLLLCVIFIFFGFYIQTIMVHIIPYAGNLNVQLKNPSLIMTIIGAFSITGRVIMGANGDKIGNKAVSVICFILMLIGACILIFLKAVWAIYMFGIFFGFSYGGLVAVISPLIADLFGLRYHGAIFGIITFVVTIGGAIGPSFTGYMVDLVQSYKLPFIILNILSFINLILILFLKPTEYQKINIAKKLG